jgi:hypothetical protein
LLPFRVFLGKTKQKIPPLWAGSKKCLNTENNIYCSDASKKTRTNLAIPSIAQGMYLQKTLDRHSDFGWLLPSRQWLLRQILTALSLLSMQALG